MTVTSAHPPGVGERQLRFAEETIRQRSRHRWWLFLVLGVLLLSTAAVSVTVGQYQIGLRQLPGVLASGPLGVETIAESVVWRIRLPRLMLGLLVGASLGVGGALMQAVFANPLAEPSVIGVTSGAGVGAALAIVFGWGFIGASTVPALAFVMALLTTWLVYRISRINGKTSVIHLILTGIAVNAVAGALISFLVFLAPTASREQIIFWQMGSLNGAQWSHVNTVLLVTVLGLVLASLLGRRLDMLALGDRAAGHLGVNVNRLRLLAIIAAALLTSGAVAYAGLIGFVGLIVPHILRTLVGPSSQVLIPASALGGATLIGAADIIARTAIPFADLPIGIFTALVGGPTFFYLLRRMMRKGRS